MIYPVALAFVEARKDGQVPMLWSLGDHLPLCLADMWHEGAKQVRSVLLGFPETAMTASEPPPWSRYVCNDAYLNGVGTGLN